MEDLSSNLEKIKSTFNPWDDAQILSHIRTHDFTRLKNLHAVDAMPARIRKRDAVDIASENYYNTVDRAPFNYAKVNNTVNTMHLQNPYRPTQRLEGYASHDYSKVRSQTETGRRTSSARYRKALSAKRLSLSFRWFLAVRIRIKIPPWDGDTTTSSRGRSLSRTRTAIRRRVRKSNGESARSW